MYRFPNGTESDNIRCLGAPWRSFWGTYGLGVSQNLHLDTFLSPICSQVGTKMARRWTTCRPNGAQMPILAAFLNSSWVVLGTQRRDLHRKGQCLKTNNPPSFLKDFKGFGGCFLRFSAPSWRHVEHLGVLFGHLGIIFALFGVRKASWIVYMGHCRLKYENPRGFGGSRTGAATCLWVLMPKFA